MVQGKDERGDVGWKHSCSMHLGQASELLRHSKSCTPHKTQRSKHTEPTVSDQTMPAQQDSTHTMHIKQGRKGCTLHSTHKALTRAPQDTSTQLDFHIKSRGARARHCSHKDPSSQPWTHTLTALLLLLDTTARPQLACQPRVTGRKLPPCLQVVLQAAERCRSLHPSAALPNSRTVHYLPLTATPKLPGCRRTTAYNML